MTKSVCSLKDTNMNAYYSGIIYNKYIFSLLCAQFGCPQWAIKGCSALISCCHIDSSFTINKLVIEKSNKEEMLPTDDVPLTAQLH